MDTTATDTLELPGGAVVHRAGLDDGRTRVDRRRGTVRPWQRLAAVIWDNQPLPVQHAVYRSAPRLGAHMDELARRRDDARRKRR